MSLQPLRYKLRVINMKNSSEESKLWKLLPSQPVFFGILGILYAGHR
jgi:hypothetical protein